ncbi:uncharacterized protein LOC129583434 [Paramacrobiotus metropolitanus]|uniref:uncharacterized protein LOC129583434 n=1 Tax=Paramacrobiotus metropolitanus TaxID=2943436 RepID=UPI002445DC3B|nr:uncharacterized protein LOC129583434 [Paramacrobiotus metropolitanus]
MAAIQCFWCLLHVLQLAIIIAAGVKVNTAAHTPAKILYKLSCAKLKPGEMQHLQLFLNRLSGAGIGLSAGGFFLVDKVFAMSIIGTYITYQLLLFQLQLDLSSSSPAPNTNATA